MEGEEGALEFETVQVYRPYVPFTDGRDHPGDLEEPSSLNCANVNVCDYTIQRKSLFQHLSAAQIDVVRLACKAFETMICNSSCRQGFFIGDGPGVGKTREICGVVAEVFETLPVHKCLWLTISDTLYDDIIHDLINMGVYAKILNLKNYSSNIQLESDGVMLTTYYQMISSGREKNDRTRLMQIVDWLTEDFEGLVVLDECHKAKSYRAVEKLSTQIGNLVVDIQHRLPKARILYSSATGFSDAKNLSYLCRLGLYGPGCDFEDSEELIEVLEKRGVSSLELLTVELKMKSLYISRILSQKDVIYELVQLKDTIEIYDDCVEIWIIMFWLVKLRPKDQYDKIMARYWSHHQNFFCALILSSKVRKTAKIARKLVEDGNTVVIGIQSTGESGLTESVKEKYSAVKQILLTTARELCQVRLDRPLIFKIRRKISAQGAKKRKLENYEDESESTSDSKSDTSDGENEKNYTEDEEVTENERDNSEEPDWTSLMEEDDYSSSSDVSDEDYSPSDYEDNSENSDKEQSDDDEKPSDLKCIIERVKAWNYRQPDMLFTKKSKKKEKEFSNIDKDEEQIRYDDEIAEQKTEMIKELSEALIKAYQKIENKLPQNPLDELIKRLGGPEAVAEMTGRIRKQIKINGRYVESRRKESNEKERKSFMDGVKKFAIISDGCSTGISLHNEKKPKRKDTDSPGQRFHLTIQFPWSADKIVQQLGRTHRSNQIQSPRYIFIVSSSYGERRLLSTLNTKLQTMGALTKGDRHANILSLDQFEFSEDIWRECICNIGSQITKGRNEVDQAIFKCLDLLHSFTRSKKREIKIHAHLRSSSKFLNRVLGLPLVLQKVLLDRLYHNMSLKIDHLKATDRYDDGIKDIVIRNGIRSNVLNEVQYNISDGSSVTLYTVAINQNFPWNGGVDILLKNHGEKCKLFYHDLKGPFAAVEQSECPGRSMKYYLVYRSYSCVPEEMGYYEVESHREIQKTQKNLVKLSKLWIKQYNDMKDGLCIHKYMQQKNKDTTCREKPCQRGKSLYELNILTGCVFKLWAPISMLVFRKRVVDEANDQKKLKTCRVETVNEGLSIKLVGILIPDDAISRVRDFLETVND